MSTTATSSLELKMNSATKVGEIFTKAGDSYNKIGDMLVMLHPAASELIALEEANQQKMLAFEQQQQQLQQQLLAAQQQQGVATITLQQPQQQQQQQQPQQQTVQQPTATRTTVTPAPQYISIGGHTVRVINGTVAIPAGGIAGIQAGQTLQLSDGTLIKTEPAQSIIQSHDVSALLDAAVSQTDSGGGSAQQSFIKFEDTPVVANEEEIGQVL